MGDTTVMAAPIPMDEEEKAFPTVAVEPPPPTESGEAAAPVEASVEKAAAAVPTAGPAVATAPVKADVAPCRTLYVRGLDEKRKPGVLRTLLHAFFSPYGELSWISCSRAVKLRGQAFITFTDIECATSALRRLAGTEFLGQPLQLQYARSESFRPQPKAKRNAAAVAAGAEKQKRKRPAPTAVPANDQAAPRVKKRQKVVPNRILFAEEVPQGGVLAERCARFAGFMEVRLVPSKPSIAFVEFQSEQHAAVALAALNSSVIKDDTTPIRLSYAKK